MRRHCFSITSAARPSLLSLVALSIVGPATGQESPLYVAVEHGDLAAVQEYLDAGGDPDGPVVDVNGEEWPILQVALYDREEGIALALLSAGAEFDQLDVPMSLVVREGMDQVLQFLLSQDPGRLTEIASSAEQAYLMRPAVGRGYHQVLDVLLQESRRARFAWDEAVLGEGVDVAIWRRHFDLARRLIDFGAPLSPRTIHVAARDGSPGIVRYILALGADPDAQLAEEDADPDGSRTPLEFAWNRYIEAIDAEREAARFVLYELTRAGASLASVAIPATVPRDGIAQLAAIPDESERTVAAARLGFYEIVAASLQSSRVHTDTLAEATAAALVSRQNDIAARLIEAGIRLDSRILNAAARGNSPGIVRYLLDQGIDPNLPVDGHTALEAWWERSQMAFVGVGGDYILHELIAAGADACWLIDYVEQLNTFESVFLRHSAPECW